MPIFQLLKDDIRFPPVALADHYGRIAIGGDLSPKRLLHAYQSGIFPWFSAGEPIVWWSPDPRFVLFPDELKVAKSMRPIFNQNKFQYSFDKNFEAVIRACRELRLKNDLHGTWITHSMVQAYIRLHHLGYAHSVEVWDEDELVGGLYGLAIGNVFFGESMFTKKSNASKAGFITLVQALLKRNFKLVDCQQETAHLESLGARPIARAAFIDILEKNTVSDKYIGTWENWLD